MAVKRPIAKTKVRRKGSTSAKLFDNMYRYEDTPAVPPKKVKVHKKKVTRRRHMFKSKHGSSTY